MKPSCNINLEKNNRDCEGNPLPVPQAPQKELPIATIPPEKLKAMQEYAAKLRRNSPSMKPERLQRKVAEHFKVKLI